MCQDVFMDDVNRRITLRTLYEQARAMAGRRQVHARPLSAGSFALGGSAWVPVALSITVQLRDLLRLTLHAWWAADTCSTAC